MMRYVFSGDVPVATAYVVSPGDSLLVTAGSTLANSFNNTSLVLGIVSGSVQNQGTIRGTGIGLCVTLRQGGNLFNNGVIDYQHQDTGSRVGAVLMGSATAGVTYSSSLTNSGTLMAHGADAIQVRLSHLTVTNTGTISATDGYYAIELYSPAQSAAGTDAQLKLVNHGIVAGDILAINLTDQYIFNDGSMTGNITLGDGNNSFTNNGAVSGNVVFGSGVNDVSIAGSVAGTISFGNGHNNLTSTGAISGSITLGTSADIVHNTGSISGAIYLGDGDDAYDGTGGSAGINVVGGQGNDLLIGGAGKDTIYGDNASGDTTGGSDTIYGAAGDDSLFGGFGNDLLFGNQSNDLLQGNQGDDYLHGGQGDDQLFGGQGSDILNGGVGDDQISGNLGDDLFIFSPNFGHDIVLDFSVFSGNNDQIDFEPGTFANYADVQSHMVQQGLNVVITLDPANDIVLNNITVAQLTSDHFIFG